MNVHFRPKMTMFDPCSCAPQSRITIPARYLMKLLILPEELVAIRPPCSPCLWLSKRLMVVCSKHSTIDLSGGTINTAANLGCWWWCCVMWSSRSWTEKKPKSSIISRSWNCSLLCCWRTCLTSRFGCWAGSWNDWYIWFPYIIKLTYNGITRLRSCNCLGIGRLSFFQKMLSSKYCSYCAGITSTQYPTYRWLTNIWRH